MAAFTTNVLSGELPLTVQFTNQSSGDITGYAWNFADGGTITEVNPMYIFTTPGQYTVSLTTIGSGGSSSAEVVIVVNPSPVLIPTPTPMPPLMAAFTTNVLAGDAPLTVTFSNQTSGDTAGYSWDFSDIPVFLLDIYAKGEKIDLTQDEKNTLKKILGRIVESYRGN